MSDTNTSDHLTATPSSDDASSVVRPRAGQSRAALRWVGRSSKRLAVLAIGLTAVGAGVAMLVLPGPGIVVIVLGLAVLATEFVWAERALDRTTTKAATVAGKFSSNSSGRIALAASGLGLILAGVLAIAMVSKAVIGVSLIVAGAVGLATLLPAAQRWIDTASKSPRS